MNEGMNEWVKDQTEQIEIWIVLLSRHNSSFNLLEHY